MIFYKFRLKSGGLVDTGVTEYWSPTLSVKDPEIPYLPLEDAAGGGFTLSAESGSYAISGTAATLLHNRVLNAEAGAYALSGTAATLLHNRVLQAESGAYAFAGTDATIVYTPSGTVYTLNAEPGAYSITGADATFVYTPNAANEVTGGGYWPTWPRLKTRKEREEEEQAKEELLAQVIAVPVPHKRATRQITMEQLIGKTAAAEMSLIDLEMEVLSIKRKKRQRDEEELLLMY